jgi:peptidyl-prolyl cis-trans isomerase SurA
LAGLLALALASCKARMPQDTLVLVNGQPISSADVESELKLQAPFEAPAATGKAKGKARRLAEAQADARAQVLEELIDEALVLQEADRLKISLGDGELQNQLDLARAGTPLGDFQKGLALRGLNYGQWSDRVRRSALCDEVVRRELRSTISIKPQDIRDYYWEHVDQFRSTASVKLRQIFCGSRGDIEKALNELRLGEPFADVAGRYSKAPEADQGGDLGWVQKKALPKKLEKAAFALKKGKFSDIISSPYGWHIFYAEDLRPEQDFSLEQSSPEILEALLRQREQPLYRDWLAALRDKAEIKRIDTPKETP